MPTLNLLGATEAELGALFERLGAPRRRALDCLKAIHFEGVGSIDEMLGLNAQLREALKQHATLTLPRVILEKSASDDTRKWLMQLPEGNVVETVYIPEANRGTLCVSSQVGCMLTCSFCSTAKQGFNRNLTAAEIIGQVWLAVRALSQKEGQHDRAITNVVMMGMGEPLLNMDALLPALSLMTHDHAYGLAKRRVTVSTSGVVPEITRLNKEQPVALAVSLHAPTDALRDELVPINRKYNLEKLMQACAEYAENDPQKCITFEYIMIDQVNDTLEQADQLAALLGSLPSKINLIPFNPFPGTEYQRSSAPRIAAFQHRLRTHGFIATIRKTRGDDIDAACGQLAGNVMDRTKRALRHKQKLA